MRTAILTKSLLSTALLFASGLSFADSLRSQDLRPGQDRKAGQDLKWATDFEAAKRAAKQSGSLILADFSGSDWCGWCRRLDQEVFQKPDFAAWAKQNVVLLQLDFPKNTPQEQELVQQNSRLAQRYAVKGYPTVVLMDADGKEVGRLGYERGGAKAWLAKADALVAKHAAPPAPELPWSTDYEEALAKAKAEGKFVLVDFTGSDWCVWCKRLEEEVFAKPEFATWVVSRAVLLKLDFPHGKRLPKEEEEQNKQLQQRFAVKGFPTILFLDAAGKELGRTGYQPGGPKAWIAAAEKEVGTTEPKGGTDR